MTNKRLVNLVQNRINELKSEQIGLKLFIQSDQVLWDTLEKAIKELKWVLEEIESTH